MKQDKWTQQLCEKLADHETPAPADLWPDIEAALSRLSPKPRSARLVALCRWAAAAGVAILLGGTVTWWGLRQGRDTQSMQTAGLAGAPSAPDTVGTERMVAQVVETESQSKAGQRQPVAAAGAKRISASPKGRDAVEEVRQQERTSEATQPVNEVCQTNNAGEDTPVTDTRHDAAPASPAATDLPWPTETDAGHTPHPRQKPTFGLYAANGFVDYENSNAVYMADALVHTYDNYAQAASRQAPIYLTGYEEQQHHRQPVAVGLSVSYPLSRRLTLQSGLVYTRLSSEFTQFVRSQRYSREQTLHYVGLPLGLSYSLWNHRSLRVYLAAAVQADWNVAAQTETEGVKQHIDLDRLQWSASGSLGVQYGLTSHLSLFAEPGIGHYFDNGSSLQNFFKDKPTSLKLQVGLRVGLE